MELLVLAALLASPVPVPAGAKAARAPAEPMPRGSRVLVLNAALAPAALEEVAAARGWKVDSAPAATQAIVAARAGKPRLMVVSAGLLDARSLGALRGAAAGAKLIFTQAAGEALPELPEQVQFEVLAAPYDAAALSAAVARAVAPRAPPTAEDKQRALEVKAAQKEKKELARRIAALTVERILEMAEPLEGEGAALEQLLERARRKAAEGPERLTPPEQDLLLASSALELGLDGFTTRREGDRANETVLSLRRVGLEAESAALEEAVRLLARHGRRASAVDRLAAKEKLEPRERARWGELSAALDRNRVDPGRARVTHALLEYARAQRKALKLETRPAPAVATAGAQP